VVKQVDEPLEGTFVGKVEKKDDTRYGNYGKI
jgi:hypothetical protein